MYTYTDYEFYSSPLRNLILLGERGGWMLRCLICFYLRNFFRQQYRFALQFLTPNARFRVESNEEGGQVPRSACQAGFNLFPCLCFVRENFAFDLAAQCRLIACWKSIVEGLIFETSSYNFQNLTTARNIARLSKEDAGRHCGRRGHLSSISLEDAKSIIKLYIILFEIMNQRLPSENARGSHVFLSVFQRLPWKHIFFLGFIINSPTLVYQDVGKSNSGHNDVLADMQVIRTLTAQAR